jgi:phage shock protein C
MTMMTTDRNQPVFFGRADTLLGICESVGQDLGFNPNWLRAGFGLVLVLNPVAVIASYFALGALVLVTRLLAPAPKVAVVTPQQDTASVSDLRQPAPVAREDAPVELALAA